MTVLSLQQRIRARLKPSLRWTSLDSQFSWSGNQLANEMATHIAFEEQRLAAAYWTLRGIQRKEETRIVEQKIEEQRLIGFMRPTADDVSAHNRSQHFACAHALKPSPHLQRKIWRQNKRIERWAKSEDIEPAHMEATIGESSEVSNDLLTPRSTLPALPQFQSTAVSSPPSRSHGTDENMSHSNKFDRPVVTPVCSSFLAASGAALAQQRTRAVSSESSPHLPVQQVERRTRRGSNEISQQEFRDAVRRSLARNSMAASAVLSVAASPEPSACHSPLRSETYSTSPSSSVAETRSHGSSSCERRKPWRSLRRLSQASSTMLKGTKGASGKTPPKNSVPPQLVYLHTGVRLSPARHLELGGAFA